MIFYQLSFIKFLNFKVGAIVFFIVICLFFNDSYHFYHFNDQLVIPYPENPKKIDIGRGEDNIWFLTDEGELYHWSSILKRLVYKDSDVLDFTVGSDGTVVLIKKDNEVYIRTIHANKWERISDEHFRHQTISICDYREIFTTDSENHFIKGIYDINTGRYNWMCVDCKNNYYQISCAPHDYSLWIKGEDVYIYRYISNNKHIVRSETQFKYIKALSDQHAIGINLSDDLWEYKDGNWYRKKKNVKSASINYAGKDIHVIYY